MPCCKRDLEIKDWCKDVDISYKDEDGKEYCTFHAPKGKKGMSVEAFNSSIFARLNAALKDGTTCDLSGTIFKGSINFDKTNKEGKLPAVDFSDTVFSGPADFGTVIFNGEAIFRLSIFKEMASFPFVTFRERADFSMATFNAGVFFYTVDRVTFEKTADFNAATFYGEVNFKVVFKGEANFENAIFYEKARFSRTIFEKMASFRKANFIKEAIFYGKTFLGSAAFTNTVIDDHLHFQNVDIKEIEFLETDLRRIDFINSYPEEKRGRYIFKDENIIFSKPKPDIREIRKLEYLYRARKQKCKMDHNEFDYSLYHMSEKEVMRQWSSPKRGCFNWAFLNLYHSLSGYGEDPRRALWLLLIILLLAPSLLGLSGFAYENGQEIYLAAPPPKIIDVQSCMVVALTTFEYLTYQKEHYYQNIEPANSRTAVLIIFFTIVVYIQTAFFIMALRNRFRR